MAPQEPLLVTLVKLWPLAGAAIMLTSMKAVTIANACAHPRLAAARRGNVSAKRRREVRRVAKFSQYITHSSLRAAILPVRASTIKCASKTDGSGTSGGAVGEYRSVG
jgi:hypothetical protein